MESLKRFLVWADKNERHLGALFFIVGFGTDLYAFGTLEIQYVIYLFIAYIAITAVATICSHYLYSHERENEKTSRKAGKVMFPLLAQYTIGSLLSGTLIFYGKSSTILVSWPFLAFLVLVFIGNEFFRKYKERLTFQTVQLFLTTYAFLLFAVPLYLHTLGRTTFLISTGLTVSAYVVFLILLYLAGRNRFATSFKLILVTSLSFLVLILGSYLLGVLPPLPLTLKDSGIYHDITHIGAVYAVQAEEPETWYSKFEPKTVHIVSGSPLFGFSSVFAPGAFSTDIVHVWEHYNPTTKKWDQVSTIAFTLSGGRNEGYRGYSELSSPAEGQWRLSVRTLSNQVIGRVNFTVVSATADPALITLEK